MGFLNKYIASTDPNFWWWNCWLVLWMTSDHSLHLINVILLILCIFSGNHYWFVSWFLFDSSGLLQTEWQSQDLNRNYFTDVFQLTRDKLAPKITSTPFLPHIPTKGRNIQALCLPFWCTIQTEHFWEKGLKIGEHKYILIFHELNFKGLKLKIGR